MPKSDIGLSQHDPYIYIYLDIPRVGLGLGFRGHLLEKLLYEGSSKCPLKRGAIGKTALFW